MKAEDGWLRIAARQSGKMVDTGKCETDGGVALHQQSQDDNNGRQFRL